VEDKFLTLLVSEPAGEGTLLDLLVAQREGLVGDMIAGHSDYEILRVFDSWRSKERG